MIVDRAERGLASVPALRAFYERRAAALKRRYCLALHRFGLLKPLTFVQWLATYSCNLSCPFCEASAGVPRPGELSTADVRRLLDDLQRMGVRRFVVSGGEPLLRRDIVEILNHATARGLRLGLVTNGLLVEDLWEDLKRQHYFLYFTSIDGPPRVHNEARRRPDAFDRAVAGLERFATLRVPARVVNTVVHPGNIGALDELAPLIQRSAATAWRLSPASPVGRAANGAYDLDGAQLRVLARFVRQRRAEMDVDFGESHSYVNCFDGGPVGKPFFCGAGLTRCSIMPNGEVVGCQQVYDPRFAEGDIRTTPFPEIWSKGFSRFRTREAPPDCRGCEHLGACQGGCWAEREIRGRCLKSAWNDGE